MNTNNSNIIQGDEAIQGMMRGVKVVTDLIRPTYGGGGVNVIVESNFNPGHMVANDAQTIVQSIRLKEPAEKRGLAFIKELCNKTDMDSGDGRKTTIILAEEILRVGYESDLPKLQLKRDLDELITIIESEISKQTKLITVDDVASVASIAGENVETGRLLQEIYQKIGKDGIIHLEGSGTFETSYKFIEGVRFDMAGFLSSSMIHNDKNRAVYEKPLILVTKKKITTDDDINPLLKEMVSMGNKDLVIFTQDMDSGVATMLVDLHKSGRFNICIIKAPSLWRDFYFEDFAKCVGATIIEDSTGKTFKNMNLTDLGTCDKIVINAEETVLIGTENISEHIENLRMKRDDDSKLRLSWLTNKTAILKLGANSETDLSYKLLKFADAIRSSELALKWGVINGAGIGLAQISMMLPDTIAGNIMKKALQAPALQIIANGEPNNTFEESIGIPRLGIVDASKVVSTAVRNAIGIASTVLTAPGLTFIPEPTELELKLQALSQQNHAF